MSTARARELAVLSLLAAHPAHGYEIAKAVSSGPLAGLGLTRPAVYKILDRFRGHGWVAEQPEPGTSYPDRTVLSLTAAGLAAQRALIAGIGDDGFATTLPLVAVTMCLDAGTPLPRAAFDRLIAARRQTLAAFPDDPAHAASATQRLARSMLETEIAVLEALRTETGERP